MSTQVDGKVLLTGASGFIGGRLRDALLAQGVDVLAIRRKGSPPAKKGRSVELNYDDVQGLEKLVSEEKPDYIFHVAGATKGVTYKDFQDANVMPTENLLAATEKHHPGLRRFVFVSSLASYGPSPVGKPLDESSPRRPVEFYGKSKLEAEEAVERRAGKVAYTIVRPSGVYGPGDVDYFNLFREAAKGRNLFFGNRDKWASVIYVDDLVDLILLAATAKAAEGKGYFGSDEVPITWGDFQSHIVDATGKRPLTLNLPGVTVDVAAFFGELVTRIDGKPRLFNKQKAIMAAQQAWTCTSASAKDDLGFMPKVFPREGCVRALGWYRDQKWM